MATTARTFCFYQSCATHALRYDSVQQRISVRGENFTRVSVCVFSRQALPATAYKAAIKALDGPDYCTAALELAREARAKLGDSAEVHVGRELMFTMEIHDLYRWFIPVCGLPFYSCSCQDLVWNSMNSHAAQVPSRSNGMDGAIAGVVTSPMHLVTLYVQMRASAHPPLTQPAEGAQNTTVPSSMLLLRGA